MISQEFTLLFVEDDASIRSEIGEFFDLLDFAKVFIAKNGQEGLEKFHSTKPDIVITDLRMPIKNGLELSRSIKEKSPLTPIILLTSQFEKEVTEEAVDIGIDAYLFKPISLQRLHTILLKYFGRIIQERAFLNQHKLLEEYKSAIDLSAAVVKMDTDAKITYVNESFCQMTGYLKAELLGETQQLLRHPETSESLYKEMWETIKAQKVWYGKIKNLRKDGTTFYENSVIVPIVDERGQTVEFIAILHDITDLYNQEQRLKQRVEDEVKKNLQETKFATIGRMAAGITHEINTPLTYVRGNLEMMLEDIKSIPDNLAQKEYLLEDMQTLLGGVNRIANIVESMREMASQSTEELTSYNLYTSLITALTLSSSKSKQITKIQIQGEPFYINMDKERYNFPVRMQKQRIEQVWVVIINNAVDALKRVDDYEKRLLDITIAQEEDAIVVRFKDNGGGIDLSILPKIFDPFESTKEEGGIGIGLNVAKRIVEDHKGRIVASNEGGGACFEVYLPLTLS